MWPAFIKHPTARIGIPIHNDLKQSIPDLIAFVHISNKFSNVYNYMHNSLIDFSTLGYAETDS
jgi:hypothetical protein